MARFAGCLREDISNETYQSGPDFENMDDAVSRPIPKISGDTFSIIVISW